MRRKLGRFRSGAALLGGRRRCAGAPRAVLVPRSGGAAAWAPAGAPPPAAAALGEAGAGGARRGRPHGRGGPELWFRRAPCCGGHRPQRSLDAVHLVARSRSGWGRGEALTWSWAENCYMSHAVCFSLPAKCLERYVS